jgi:glycosyltransferase involved in cell wall biosynthesis
MRVLLALHHWLDANQGAPGATVDLGAALRDRGHIVDYFGFEHLRPSLSDKGKGLIFPLAVARHLAGNRDAYDVVDGASADLAAALVVRRRLPSRIAWVTRSHGLAATAYTNLLEDADAGGPPVRLRYRIRQGRIYLPAEAYATRRSDVALFLNSPDREFGIEHMGVCADRARVVTNGVLPLLLGRELERIDDDTVRVAQIGRYTSAKGVRYGTPALAAAMSSDARLEVTFLGTGVDEPRVREDFPEALRHRVRVVPEYRREDLVTLLSGHSIKFFPTTSEGFAIALVEAMALGLAPIATAIPGSLEVARDETNALVVPPGDTGAMTAALLRLASDRTLRDRLRANARNTAQRYSWPTIARHTETLYEQARDIAAHR